MWDHLVLKDEIQLYARIYNQSQAQAKGTSGPHTDLEREEQLKRELQSESCAGENGYMVLWLGFLTLKKIVEHITKVSATVPGGLADY